MSRQHQLAADFALENAPKLNFASRLWGNDANYNFHVRHWGAFTHEARLWTRVHDLLKLGIFYPVQEVIFIARTHPALSRMR